MILQSYSGSLAYSQNSLSLPPYSSVEHLDGNRDPVPPYADAVETFFEGCGRESEAAVILRGDDLQLIQLLGQFRFFQDEELRAFLEAHFDHPLDLLDTYLPSPENEYSPAEASKLNRDQKIEEILRQLKPSTSILVSTLNWSPRGVAKQTTAGQIAAQIHRESSRQFKQISFEDLVEQARGHPVDSVEDFVFGHQVLFVRLSSYLVLHPEEWEKYTQVENVS